MRKIKIKELNKLKKINNSLYFNLSKNIISKI